MERGIQYLKELAVLEVIYGDLDNEQLSKDPDEVQCTRPMWQKLVTVPSTRVHTRVPACPVQQHRNSSDALAICQPRRKAIAVIKMFPGTAEVTPVKTFLTTVPQNILATKLERYGFDG
ncbi:hypothetical protein QYF61_018469 [Mycteria americana]|uniref:Uncharacterized protein n=1 Tax=Mycteria americana TaxID=33587 RepID=A0AAN7NBA0_MYCAM|nr:hypothetical protein QYF61_018469 [Mycteria americana]